MPADKQHKLWTSSFIKICLVNFFIFINFHALLTTFPFFVTYLGGDAVTIGLATALFSIASIVSRPFVGWLVDSKGRCTILILGMVGMTLIPMGYFISTGVAFAVLLRTLHGAFHAASSNAASTWVTDIVPRNRMGEGLGMYGLSMAISTAVAPALGLMVMKELGFQPLFAVTALAALVALLLGTSIKDRPAKLSKEPLKLNGLFEKLSVPASITQFFFMMAYGVIEVYVSIYASKHGLPSGAIYFAAIALATVLSRIALGRSLDKYGEHILVLTGNLAIIIGILLLVYIQTITGYILSAILLGYSFGAIQPAMQTMAMHAVAPERRGAASSTFFIAFDFGIALGGFLAGVLVKLYGYDNMFLLISLACVCSYTYYWVAGRNHSTSFNPATRKAHATQAQEPASAEETEKLPFVVTISREYGSGGHHIGVLLAQKLGVRLYDKNLIRIISRQSGLDIEDIVYSEQAENGRMLYDNPVQDTIFHTQSKVIREAAAKEPCVIVGRLANFILRGRARCFSIFVYASEEYRTRWIMEHDGLNREEAIETMHTVDRKRREYCLHFTGGQWGNRHHYHMMIDSSVASDERTAEMLCQVIKQTLEKQP